MWYNPRMSQDWDADAALQSLKAEKVYDGIDLTEAESAQVNETATRILRQGAVVSAMAVVHIATYSDNERLRLQAAQYVLERNLGKVGEQPTVTAKDAWAELLDKCLVATNSENGMGK